MDHPRPVLVCFAVPEEAAPFRPRCPADVEILVTGMGGSHAHRRVGDYLANHSPALVLTAGFAGALDPALAVGDVVYDADPDAQLEPRLQASGAKHAIIYCAEHVATTAAAKLALRASTGADVVEMESGVIRALCQKRGIPSATIRVISDTAGEDLPLDFNRLMTPGGRLSLPLLVLDILRSPRRIGGLIRLGRNSARASRQLAGVLSACLPP